MVFFLGLIVSLQLFRGDLDALRRENQTLFNGAVTLTRKLGFPDIILPGRSGRYFLTFYDQMYTTLSVRFTNMSVALIFNNNKKTYTLYRVHP